MKQIKKMWMNLHEDDKFFIELVTVMLTVMLVLFPSMVNAQVMPAKPIHIEIEVQEKGADSTQCVGTIAVKKKTADGKTETNVYKLYRGSKGGYFYYTGKVNKNGKPEKKYLTKKQKEEKGLK